MPKDSSKPQVRRSSRRAVAGLIRLVKGKNLAKDKVIWIDLSGCSYAVLADSRETTARAVAELRQLADWLETTAVDHFDGS